MRGERSFDFLIGDWSVEHRKLRDRLVGATAWNSFRGETRVRPLLGGAGNYDDNVLHPPQGSYKALTVRRYVPTEDSWSIWWVDARTMKLDPPVAGRFDDGIGTFLGDDMLHGKPIKVKFVWSDVTSTSAEWQQAFSGDAGASWEVNWTMKFKRETKA